MKSPLIIFLACASRQFYR